MPTTGLVNTTSLAVLARLSASAALGGKPAGDRDFGSDVSRSGAGSICGLAVQPGTKSEMWLLISSSHFTKNGRVRTGAMLILIGGLPIPPCPVSNRVLQLPHFLIRRRWWGIGSTFCSRKEPTEETTLIGGSVLGASRTLAEMGTDHFLHLSQHPTRGVNATWILGFIR